MSLKSRNKIRFAIIIKIENSLVATKVYSKELIFRKIIKIIKKYWKSISNLVYISKLYWLNKEIKSTTLILYY